MAKDFPVFPDVFDQFIVELFAEGDDGLEGIGPEDGGPVGADECPTLIFLGIWELFDGVEDLNTGVGVDVQTRVVWATGERLRERMKRKNGYTYAPRMAAITPAFLILTATTGFNFLTASSKGTRRAFS